MSRVKRGAEYCINISASPWRLGIPEARRELLKSRSKAAGIPIIYVNQFGGNDCLVFDGSSLIADKGEILLETPRWKEEMSLFTLPPIPMGGQGGVRSRTPSDSFFDDLISALKLGISDYFDKTGAFQKTGIALSGGKDSALALLLAWDIFQERKQSGVVNAFSMPTRYNSDVTKNIARDLSRELGVNFTELSIEDAFAREVEATRAMSGREPDAMTLQNIQARIRALRMWNWSNTERGLWLQTGNMSEKAVGYTTIGGDLSGGFAPLANVPKTVVTALIAHYNERLKLPSLSALLATKASAELAPDQFDERDLMPYPVLDRCFELFAGKKLTLRETYETLAIEFSEENLRGLDPSYKAGQLKEWVKKFGRLFVLSIYKWVQAPEGVHVSDLDFDRDRALQLPVVQSLEWLKLEEF
jgi:NAD+ synthase (glutamine-hydrolysing)